MRCKVTLIALATLAGCSTTGDLRQKEPVMSESSDKPPAEIVACASDALSLRRLIWSVLPRQTGSAIILGPTHNPDLVADIEKAGVATSIKIYRQPRMYFGLSRAFVNIIRGCSGLPIVASE